MVDVIPIAAPKGKPFCREQIIPANDLFAPGGFGTALNSVPVASACLARAIDTIRHIPVRSPADVAEHGRRLAAIAQEHRLADYGGAALHARATAPLVETDEGLGFDPHGFFEQIDKWTQIFA